MRPVPIMSSLVLLAACAAPTGSGADLKARQTEACTATIAAHVGRPESEITARWLSADAGTAQVETLDGGRRHICTVDAAGRVLGYVHPGA